MKNKWILMMSVVLGGAMLLSVGCARAEKEAAEPVAVEQPTSEAVSEAAVEHPEAAPPKDHPAH